MRSVWTLPCTANEWEKGAASTVCTPTRVNRALVVSGDAVSDSAGAPQPTSNAVDTATRPRGFKIFFMVVDWMR